MITSSEVIVLSRIKYGDASIIVKAYALEYGLITLMVKNARGGKKSQGNYYQPGSILNIDFYQNRKSDISNVKSTTLAVSNLFITDIAKSAIMMFFSEVVLRYWKEEVPSESFYKFYRETIITLTLLEDRKMINTYPLKFLISFSNFLGLKPMINDGVGLRFCLVEGSFLPSSLCKSPISEELSSKLKSILKGTNLLPDKKSASLLLQTLTDYFDIQLSRSGKLKTLGVLKEISG